MPSTLSPPESSEKLDRLVQRASQLYTLPRVAVEVLRLTGQPNVDTRQIRECIEHDPALTGKILRTVNSSLFALSKPVSDLNQALALLGIKPLKLLVLGFSLPGRLFSDMASELLSQYWQRTIVRAVSAREISQRVWNLPGDEAFVAGLLQDLGMLVLIQDLGEAYVRFLERMRIEGADAAFLERETIGFDRSELTARLLASWNLAPAIVEAARLPRSMEELELTSCPGPSLPRILHTAGLLADLLSGRTSVLPDLLDAAQRHHRLDLRELTELVVDLQEKVSQLADIFSLQLPSGLEYRDVMTQAHIRLASVAEEAAGDLLQNRQERQKARLPDLLEMQETVALYQSLSLWTPPASAQASEDDVPLRMEPLPRRRPGLPTQPAMTDHDPALVGCLTAVVAACRQLRRPVSLLLVEVDNFSDLVLTVGEGGAARILQAVEGLCRKLDQTSLHVLLVADARFAVVLPHCERSAAVRHANRLLAEIRELRVASSNDLQPRASLSIGVAAVTLPPRNFQADDLIVSADRCLSGARSSGGNCVKSIEI